MRLRSFFLFANPGKPQTIHVARQFADLALEAGCQVTLDEWLFHEIQTGKPGSLEDLIPGFDAIICFGGDGTLLRLVPQAAAHQLPILGINLGHTGFLLEIGPDQIQTALTRLMQGDYCIDERPLLSCVINGRAQDLALNEVALSRGINPSSLVIDVLYQEEPVYTIHGDGVLVSAPSGTTGYSLSAGGPVVHPSLSCVLITPICSHIMHQRPIVLPMEGQIRLVVREGRNKQHQVCVDGQIVYNLDEVSEVVIMRSMQSAQLIRFSPRQFLTRLNIKQLEWSKNIYGGKI